ncbi:hypothetical protein F2Q70_00002275 [Brassica cretica]|uniref:Uncharacterized protein n=1 Tax=Brassica cretica TaxID=69181 RepID=A0A8S9IVF2_BRACR|nr:hypothetical protein F2Q70_00002275 [Brassica cretica]
MLERKLNYGRGDGDEAGCDGKGTVGDGEDGFDHPTRPENRKAWPGLGRATARSVSSRVRSLGLTLEYF